MSAEREKNPRTTFQLSQKNTICHVIDFFFSVSLLFICFSSSFDFIRSILLSFFSVHFVLCRVKNVLSERNKCDGLDGWWWCRARRDNFVRMWNFKHIKWSLWSCFALDFIISAFKAIFSVEICSWWLLWKLSPSFIMPQLLCLNSKYFAFCWSTTASCFVTNKRQ